MPIEVLSPRILSLKSRQDQLTAAREEAQGQLEQRRVELPTTEEVKWYVVDFREFLQEGTFPERKALIRNFVEGIEVVGDEAVLTYTIPMPSDGVSTESASVLDFVHPGPPPRTEFITPPLRATSAAASNCSFRVPVLPDALGGVGHLDVGGLDDLPDAVEAPLDLHQFPFDGLQPFPLLPGNPVHFLVRQPHQIADVGLGGEALPDLVNGVTTEGKVFSTRNTPAIAGPGSRRRPD